MTTKIRIAAAVKEFKALVQSAGDWFADAAYEKGLRDGIAMVKPPKNDPFAADATPLPEWLPAQAWQDWCDHRRDCKLPMTARAGVLQVKHLERLRDAGQDPVEVIEQSVRTGKWTDLYPVKNAPGPAQAFKPGQSLSATTTFGAKTGGKSWRERTNDQAEEDFLKRTGGA